MPEPEDMEEALDHDRSDDAGSDAVAPFRLEMVEECEDGVDVERHDLDPARADSVSDCGEDR